MTSAICDPEQNPAVLHSKPSIDIAAYLDHGAVTGCDLPTRQHQGFLRYQGLLGQTRGCQIALQITAPFLQFSVLPFQLSPHRAEPKLRLDSRAQHCRIHRLRHKIVSTGLETGYLAFFTAMRGQHDGGNLRDGWV